MSELWVGRGGFYEWVRVGLLSEFRVSKGGFDE